MNLNCWRGPDNHAIGITARGPEAQSELLLLQLC